MRDDGDRAAVGVVLPANCFGDHCTRTRLDLRPRELLTLAVLISLVGADPQVKGYIAANLTVGNDRATMLDVITQPLPSVGRPRTLDALASPRRDRAGRLSGTAGGPPDGRCGLPAGIQICQDDPPSKEGRNIPGPADVYLAGPRMAPVGIPRM